LLGLTFTFEYEGIASTTTGIQKPDGKDQSRQTANSGEKGPPGGGGKGDRNHKGMRDRQGP